MDKNKKTQKTSKTTKIFIAIAVAFVAVFIAIGGYNLLKDRFGIGNVAFSLNGKNYSKSDLQKQYDDPANKGLSKKQITESYIELEKQKYVAEKLGVMPTQGELDYTQKSIFSDLGNKNLNQTQKLTVYGTALNFAKSRIRNGDMRGALFTFPYSKRIEAVPAGAPKPVGWGNPAAIEQDKQYSLSRANESKSQLTDSKITVDELIKKIKQDPKLDYYNAPNDSTKFDDQPKNTYTDVIYNPDMLNFIKSQTKTGISEIQIAKVAKKSDGTDLVDGINYFTYLEKITKPMPNIDNDFDNQLKSLKVKVYVKI